MKKDMRSYPEENCVIVTIKSRSQYLGILDMIRKDTAKIILVQIDGEDKNDPVVNTAKEMMALEKREIVSEWFGTITRGRAAVQYTFTKKRDFFAYLRSFESFFIVTSENPYRVRLTNFGYDDIAFLDARGELLFFTTTHEGYAYLNNKYLSQEK